MSCLGGQCPLCFYACVGLLERRCKDENNDNIKLSSMFPFPLGGPQSTQRPDSILFPLFMFVFSLAIVSFIALPISHLTDGR